MVDWQVFSLTKKQVQLLSQSMPLDTKFYEIDGQYQIKLSPNSIFIHAFGSYIDIGYVMFLYKNKIYYVNIDPTVKLTTFIFERMDDLSHMAKIAITLNNLIGNQRKNILIKLEGTLAQAK